MISVVHETEFSHLSQLVVEDPGLVLTLAFVLWNMNGRHSQVFPGWVANDRSVVSITPESYILKAKKFAEPLFQEKKFAEKVRKSGRHIWAIWG